jgi:hypothetical protein
MECESDSKLELCQVPGVSISGVEPSSSITREFIVVIVIVIIVISLKAIE